MLAPIVERLSVAVRAVATIRRISLVPRLTIAVCAVSVGCVAELVTVLAPSAARVAVVTLHVGSVAELGHTVIVPALGISAVVKIS